MFMKMKIDHLRRCTLARKSCFFLGTFLSKFTRACIAGPVNSNGQRKGRHMSTWGKNGNGKLSSGKLPLSMSCHEGLVLWFDISGLSHARHRVYVTVHKWLGFMMREN